MEPVLLIALVLAFGIRPELAGSSMPRAEILGRLEAAAFLLAAQVVLVVLVGRLLRWRASRTPGGAGASRRALALCGRAIALMTVGGYAYLLFELDWAAVVEHGFGLRRVILADEVLILAPFLAVRFVTWWALYPAEIAIRSGPRPRPGRAGEVGRYLVRRARQSLGLVLPATLIYALNSDVVERRWPGAAENPYAPLVGMVLMGGLVLAAAPAFVRLTWPMRRLPPGPLRDRLERLSRRLGFRYSDILVWETGGAFVNAGVTGALPWYRYVLLTDTLIDSLEERSIEAVFGHEIGHVAHRHLAFFGLFFVGCLGVMALIKQGINQLAWRALIVPLGLDARSPDLALGLEMGLVLACLAAYFLFLFGFLSRRFERQADLYGCRAVSCGRAACPPHADLGASDVAAHAVASGVCPVGIRIFANALSNVALLNGLEPKARSWRHGSIARRIAFLEGLEGRPDRERRFQSGTAGLRLTLMACMLAAFVLAMVTGALDQL